MEENAAEEPPKKTWFVSYVKGTAHSYVYGHKQVTMHPLAWVRKERDLWDEQVVITWYRELSAEELADVAAQL